MSTSKEESERRIGTTIDQKWQIEALIAYSSVAATYKATHRINGRDVALKIIHRSHGSYAVLVERFLKEAHLANRVEHPGVERVFDDGTTEDGCVFLVMELLEGETLELRRVTKGGRLPLAEARSIFDGLLDALIAVHSAGVVHRNLKPGNVFLTRDGRVVLTDFGRARLSDGDPKAGPSIEGVVAGATAYMSPEQASGKRSEIDTRSDIWSAGAIMFTVLSGRRVHEAETNEQRLVLATTKPAPELSSVVRGLPPPLGRVIDRALAFEKSRRWDTASEMRYAYWLATGREANTIPIERKPSRPPPHEPTPQTPPWEAMGWPVGGAPEPTPSEMALLPPPVAAFVAPKESAKLHTKKLRRKKYLRRSLAFLVGLLVAAGTGWLVWLNYSDDDRRAPRAPAASASATGR